MTYLFLLYGDETQDADLSPEDMAAYMEPWEIYTRMLEERGAMLGGEALMPTTMATTVTATSGKPVWTDGPFAETREQLGGFYLVKCDTLEEAQDLAAQCPAVHNGRVEVRPIMDLSAG